MVKTVTNKLALLIYMIVLLNFYMIGQAAIIESIESLTLKVLEIKNKNKKGV